MHTAAHKDKIRHATMMTVFRTYFLFLIFSLLTGGCNANTGASTPPQAEDTPSDRVSAYEQALRRWQNNQITRYQLTYKYLCFCDSDLTRPIQVVVSNGTAISGIFIDDNKPLTPSLLKSTLTINQAFQLINKAIEHNAYKLDVRYDKTYGYPTKLFVDIDSRLADDTQDIEILNFQILE
jgi:hypothetical protein